VQSETKIVRSGLLINECFLLDAADVTLLADARVQGSCVDLDVGIGLFHPDRLRCCNFYGSEQDERWWEKSGKSK
jgi:hypothetical protein